MKAINRLTKEAAEWRKAAARIVAARGTLYLFEVTTTRPMKRRHDRHAKDRQFVRQPLTRHSRSLFCLFMACECKDDIAAARGKEA